MIRTPRASRLTSRSSARAQNTSGRVVGQPVGTLAGCIELKSAQDIDGLRAAGALVARALDAAKRACVVGATTADIDRAAHQSIERDGGEAIFVGYRGLSGTHPAYPAASCISVNDDLVHGVPGARVIRDGDLVSIDVGARLNGWCADSALTVCVGAVAAQSKAMVACAELMLERAISAAKPGRRWSSIANEMEAIAVAAGYAIAVDFVGHGIGRTLHEAPQVPCNASRSFESNGDFTLRPGMVLAIEPMLVREQLARHAAGNRAGELVSPSCTLTSDGWTIRVNSGAPSCHVEHTIAITRDGAEVLTRRAVCSTDRANDLRSPRTLPRFHSTPMTRSGPTAFAQEDCHHG